MDSLRIRNMRDGIDQVGEETDLEEGSLCFAAACFACVSVHRTEQAF